MLTEADRQLFRAGFEKIDAQAFTVLDRILGVAQTFGEADELRQEVLSAIPLIIESHGNLTAELAAELYALARVTAGLDDLFTPTPFVDIPEEMIAGSVQWALTPLEKVTGTPGKHTPPRAAFSEAKERLIRVTTRLGRKAAAQTVLENALRDPENPRMRRVPSPGACGWCMMLAARGYTYDKDTVLKTHAGTKYHDRCKCSSEPQYADEDTPPFLKRLEEAWDKHAHPEGKGSPPNKEAFYAFVEDGGLGDRPIPGRGRDKRYRKTIQGQEVPFMRSDITVFLRDQNRKKGVWYEHILKQPSARSAGGHLDEFADQWLQIARDGNMRAPRKSLFPQDYGFEDFNRQVRATLGDPTAIIKPNESADVFEMRREFRDLTLAVVVAPKRGGGYKVVTAYPLAGSGRQVIRDTLTIAPLPSSIDRRFKS